MTWSASGQKPSERRMARFLEMARDLRCDWSGRRLDRAFRELAPPKRPPEPLRAEPASITPFTAARHSDQAPEPSPGEPLKTS
jgi:hypothetical protein